MSIIHYHQRQSHLYFYLILNMYKSLHDIVLFLFLLQKEREQFNVSFLIVHLI